MIIPFTYNILKRHPALMTMIHRSGDSKELFNGLSTVFQVTRVRNETL